MFNNLIIKVMKKIFILAAVTAIALTACTKTETTAVSEGNLIKFDNAFVGNPTKAEVTQIDNKSIQNFYVYANKDNAQLFEGEKVYLQNGNWAYDNLKTWDESATSYAFAAYSNGGVEGTDGTTTATVAFTENKLTLTDYTVDYEDQRDLVVAYSPTTLADRNTPVEFAFSHALAMVKFTIESSLGTTEVGISDFKVNGFMNKADLTLESASSTIVWDTPDESATILNSTALTATTETAAVSDEFVVIPQTVSAGTVTFKASITLGSDPAIEKVITAKIPETYFNSGYRYNFIATITGTNMDVIEFAAPTVSEWKDYTDTSISDDQVTSAPSI